MAPQTLDRLAVPGPRLARITVEQYHVMLEAGVLQEGDPIELIDGVLVYKDRGGRGESVMTIGKRHAMAVLLLLELAPALAKRNRHMRPQLPLTLLPNDEPEPDGTVVRGHARDYLDRHPGPADASSVIEVADSSLPQDRTFKLQIYARAAIPQYLIVNLVDNVIEVFGEPRPAEGIYARTAVLHRADTLQLDLGEGAFLDVPVGALLP